MLAGKGYAIIEGRKVVAKTDIHNMTPAICRRRLILSFEAERKNMDVEAVIQSLLKYNDY